MTAFIRSNVTAQLGFNTKTFALSATMRSFAYCKM